MSAKTAQFLPRRTTASSFHAQILRQVTTTRQSIHSQRRRLATTIHETHSEEDETKHCSNGNSKPMVYATQNGQQKTNLTITQHEVTLSILEKRDFCHKRSNRGRVLKKTDTYAVQSGCTGRHGYRKTAILFLFLFYFSNTSARTLLVRPQHCEWFPKK